MIEDLGLRAGIDGRVVRHAAGDLRRHAHSHAELEVNLVERGTASYLLGERRYQLTAGTLTWLFPGQEHVLVDESADHALWWAVFRPSLVARTATSPHTRPLLERDPVGRYSRRLDPDQLQRLGALFRDLRTTETLDDTGAGNLAQLARIVGLSPSHLSRLFNGQMGLSISRFRNQQRLQRFLRLYGNGRRTTALAAAHRAGFGSYAQFYRVFREEAGRRPSALRTAAAEEGARSIAPPDPPVSPRPHIG